MLRSVLIVDTDGSNPTFTESYMYNANGQRMIKDTEGVLTKYFYSGSTVLITEDQSNNKLTENIVDLSGAIISSKRFSGTEDWYSYNYDIRSSTTAILDGTGALKNGYQYDAFGNATSSGTLLNETSFTGAISDINTGLYYMNARYYNSNTGRFLTQDSYKGSAYSPWTQNLYTYMGNNPVNFTDPTGHYAWYAQPALIDGTHLNQPLYYTGSNSGGSSVVPDPEPSGGSGSSGSGGSKEDAENWDPDTSRQTYAWENYNDTKSMLAEMYGELYDTSFLLYDQWINTISASKYFWDSVGVFVATDATPVGTIIGQNTYNGYVGGSWQGALVGLGFGILEVGVESWVVFVEDGAKAIDAYKSYKNELNSYYNIFNEYNRINSLIDFYENEKKTYYGIATGQIDQR